MKNLPKGWTACEVSSVAEVNPRKPKAAPDELVSFVGMADVSEDMRLVNHAPRPYAEVANGFTGFEDNDLLIAKITPCFENGKGALVTGLTNGKGFGSTEFHVVRAEDESTRRLLYHHFSTHEFRVRGEANMTGSAGQKRIPTSFISEYVVPIPPKADREKIVAILDACDRAIDGTAQLLEKQEKRFEVLQETLTSGVKRLPQFAQSTWKEVPLGSLFSERSERGHIRLPLLSITSKQGLVHRDELEKRDTSNSDKSKYKAIRVGDIGYNTMRLWQGVAAVADKEGIISPAYTVVVPGKSIDVQFAGFLFKTQSVIYKFWRYSQGLVDDTLNCKFPSFAKVKVLIPESVDEQKAIAKVLSSADKEIKLLRQQLTLLQQQKKGLMQRLLTGQAFTR
ncbi:restriction endonuclease subunit S [Hymenobacter pini]|uniref:restriction endonuclease subunit S n=1 Tax=Hymenobacter pini TaxID=2880879 RepID=UPI001CF502D4|nr:restriction endonuclease subunit S [Hymenobacter pini]MCA8831909.1 restriction endonuclease subunit S [Hymenobacter pini]